MTHKPLGDGGKTSARRNENTAAVEANWPTNWDTRDAMREMQAAQGSDVEGGQEAEGATE